MKPDFSNPETLWAILLDLLEDYPNIVMEQQAEPSTGVVMTYITHYPIKKI